jgi:Spy/CpxP family protein refolding chaperone
MIRNQVFFIPLVVATAFATLAHAAPPTVSSASSSASRSENSAKLGHSHYGSHLEPILKSVNATAEQRVKITAILNDFRPKIEPIVIEYREKRDQFLAAITSGKSAEEIMLKQDEVGQLRSHIANEYCVMHLKVRHCLNGEQVTAYEQYRHLQGWVK